MGIRKAHKPCQRLVTLSSLQCYWFAGAIDALLSGFHGNLVTAKAIGVAVPEAVVQDAKQVIR